MCGVNCTRRTRRGVSLLETVLAVSILAVALAALGHQTFVGLRASVRTELETHAALLCQSRMEWLLSESGAPATIPESPVPGVPEWRWSAEIVPAPEVDGMRWLVVSVHQPGAQAEFSRYVLSRLVAEDVGRQGAF